MKTLRLAQLILVAAVAGVATLPADAAKIPPIRAPKSAATLAMTSVDAGDVHLTNILVNGKSISQPVAPGSTVQISFDWSLSDPCSGCLIEGYIGFQGTPATCFTDGVFPGTSGSFSGSLTAPDKPGTYLVMVNDTLDIQCDAITSGGGGLSSIAAYVVALKVK